MSAPQSAPPSAGRREWLALIVLVIPALIVGIDMTVLHLAVPQMSEDLEPTSSELLWIVDSYGFMVAGFLITMGTIGDRMGRRRLWLIGTALFCALSVVAFLVETAEALIVVRALLGIAGAALSPSTVSLIRTLFADEKQRLVAISVWAVAWFGGMALGPVVGGGVIEWLDWQWVFLIAVPFMVPALILGPILLPEAKDTEAGRIDLVSVALSILGVISVIWGLKHIAEEGVDGQAIGAILLGLALVALFIRRQTHLKDPLLDLALLKNPRVSAALSTQTIIVLALGGTQFFIGQHLQLVMGYSALETGAWLLIPTLAGIVATMIGPELAKKVHPAHLIGGGCAVAALGMALLMSVYSDRLSVVLIGYGLLWIGSGPMFALCADLIVGSAPEERAGGAGALSETGNEFGFALGIGLVGTAGIALYRRQIDMPAGMTEEQEDAARDNLGSAMNTAAELPADVGAQLLESGRQAFTDGLALSAGLGAALCLIGAVLGTALLSSVNLAGHAHGGSGPDEGSGPVEGVPDDRDEAGVDAVELGGARVGGELDDAALDHPREPAGGLHGV
ncbi:MFS transporter [Sporichthya polymorpha]|uniref:MFS transporter n=1 Tax=Sporichthya polymorpha TaxID=35751 RepID=UPI0003740F74